MWFTKSIEDTLKALNVNPETGLTSEEAVNRLKQFGPNRLEAKKKKTVKKVRKTVKTTQKKRTTTEKKRVTTHQPKTTTENSKNHTKEEFNVDYKVE